jgi:hypothetical protein
MKTCKIINLPNLIGPRTGRPNLNRYYPSRKRLLAADRPVGRKARRVRTTAQGG